MKCAVRDKVSRPGSDGGRASQYAAAEEFCSIFSKNTKELYSLALWLTADHNKAEQCFVGAFDDCRRATVIFKAWAQSWSRLAVIENAIRMMKPALSDVLRPVSGAGDPLPEGIHPHAGRVLRLNSFDRFVYVMSVLDRYSSRDCAILLRCTRQDVEKAQWRAMQAVSAQNASQVRAATVERPLFWQATQS